MNERLNERVRWGVHQDHKFYGAWVVQPVDNPTEDRKFWFLENDDAEKFILLLNKSIHKAFK